MKYKLFVDGSGQSNVVVRTDDDGAQWFIPKNEDNADYLFYLAWLAEGNTPLPADPSPAS
jgi:hypothetical protein